MSQQQHTQEPWSLCEVENYTGRIKHLVPVDGEKLSILTLVENEQATFAAIYKDEDARRIVACVNACAGIPTDELETAGRLAAAEEATLRRLQKQRDTLLKLVECISQQTPEKPDYWSSCSQCEHNISDAEDAIASVKGGAA